MECSRICRYEVAGLRNWEPHCQLVLGPTYAEDKIGLVRVDPTGVEQIIQEKTGS